MVHWIVARQHDPALGRGAILLEAYGGAINRVPRAATAFVHRDALFSCQYLAYWQPTDPPQTRAANLRWIRAFYAALISSSRSALRSADGGTHWQPIKGLPNSTSGFAIRPRDDALYAWSGRTIFRGEDHGIKWKALPPLPS